MEFISLITAFGLGSIVTALVQAWLSNRASDSERSFKEKQTAFIGLLEAYHRAAVHGSDENSKLFAYWQMRCELVSSSSVRDAIQKMISTNDDPIGRLKADQDMRQAMRRDLGITR